MTDELDMTKLDQALKELTATQMALATAVAALIANHSDKNWVSASYTHHLPPKVRETASGGHAPNTKQVLSWISTALKGGFQPPHR